MQDRSTGILTAAVIGALLISSAPAQDSEQNKSPELDVLSQFVGEWKGETVVKSTDAEAVTINDESIMKWTLGGKYLEDRVGGTNPTLIGMWTYDSEAKVYRAWYFPAGSNNPIILTGRWNESTRSFTEKVDMGNGVVMTGMHKFIGKNRYEWTGTIRDESGKVLTEYKGTKTRK